MNVSLEIVSFIKEFEGFSSKVYICPAGIKTIGYGHVMSNKESFKNISEGKAEALLYQDIYKAQSSVLRNISIKLTKKQFDALTSFTFNLGAAALQRSTLRQKVNRKDHTQVPKELRRWVYACGRVLPGLIRRREGEALLYMS